MKRSTSVCTFHDDSQALGRVLLFLLLLLFTKKMERQSQRENETIVTGREGVFLVNGWPSAKVGGKEADIANLQVVKINTRDVNNQMIPVGPNFLSSVFSYAAGISFLLQSKFEYTRSFNKIKVQTRSNQLCC